MKVTTAVFALCVYSLFVEVSDSLSMTAASISAPPADQRDDSNFLGSYISTGPGIMEQVWQETCPPTMFRATP